VSTGQACGTPDSNSLALMRGVMASHAKRYQILRRIIAGMASELFVVNLKVRPSTAGLALPTIAM
jgi:hypothetical protein